MPFVAIGSAKASPGVTTLACALATSLPIGCPRLVIEADPDGGSVAGRRNLGYEPGLVEYAAVARRDVPTDVKPSDFAQPLSDDIRVMPAPSSADQAHAALMASASVLATAAAGDASSLTFVDVGRISARSPSLELMKRAAVVLMAARPAVDELAHLPSRIDVLHRAGVVVEFISVGNRPYDPNEVADHLGIPLFGTWTDDRVAAEQFWRSGPSGRAVQRSAWWRSTLELSSRLAARMRDDLVIPMPLGLGSIGSER